MNHPARQSFAPRFRRSLSASTLAATMMVVAAIAAFLSVAALMTSQFGRYAGRQSGDSDQMAACDAALDYAYSQWKTTTYNSMHSATPSLPTTTACYPLNTVGGTSSNMTSPNPMAAAFNNYYQKTFANSAGVTCFNLQIYYTDQNAQPTSYDSNGEPVFKTGTPTKVTTKNVPGYPGWSGSTAYYVAVAGVTAPGRYGNPKPVSACRYFQVTTVPLFQAAIFYENKLEIHPGAPMIITGLVHSNGDIWARGLYQLQFKNNVSSVGKLYEYGDNSVYYGWDGNGAGYVFGASNRGIDLTNVAQQVTWQDGKTTAGGSATRTGQVNQQVSTIDPFGGATTSSNGLHDIVEKPTNNSSDQIAYNNAALRIAIDDTVSPTIKVGSTTTINPAYIKMTDKTGAQLLSTSDDYKAVYDALNSYPTTNVNSGSTSLVQNFQDLREQSTVTVTSLDMAKLAVATVPAKSKKATDFQTAFANSGTVYIHYERANGTAVAGGTRQAIRLYNGGKLGQNVSVASDNGMYIQGDYNVGTNTYTDVPSNQTGASTYAAGTGDPQVSGYNRYSSAVMADAVTILSNTWKDNLSGDQTLGNRKAVPTTVNTAILAGDVATSDSRFPSYAGYASGGAHNFPRFLEDWGGVNFTYYGSLVEAFNSETFIGKWQTGKVYNWPNRMWNFDINFLTQQPPGVPSGLQFSRGRWQQIQLSSNL